MESSSPYFGALPTDKNFRAAMQKRGSAEWPPEYWESWGYCFCCIWGLCLAYAAAVLFARPTGNRLLAIFSVKPDEPRPLHRAHFLFLLGLCLSVLVALWLAVPYIILGRNENFLQAHGMAGWRATALVVACSGMAVTACLGLFRRGEDSRPSGAHWVGLASAGTAALILLACVARVHSEISKPLLTALGSSAILAAFAALPASLPQFGVDAETAARRTTLLMRGALLFFASLLLVGIGAVSLPPAFLRNSSSLSALWKLFYSGTAVLGGMIGVCTIPVIDALAGIKRIRQLELRNRPALRREREFLRWTSTLASDIYLWLTVACALAGTVVLFWTAEKIGNQSDPERFLAACRSINLTSGVCPLTPLTFAVLSLTVWCFVQLRRVSYHEDRCPSVPRLPNDLFCPRLRRVVKDVQWRIIGDFFHPTYNVVCAVSVITSICINFLRGQETLETKSMDIAMLLFACCVGVCLITVCARLVLIWSAFHEFLQQLERHPMREIFEFLPRGFLWAPLWQGGQRKRTHVAITRSLECIQALVNNPRTPAELVAVLNAKLPELKAAVKIILRSAAARNRVSAPDYHRVQEQLACLGTAVAHQLADKKWPYGNYEARAELANRNVTKDALSITRGEFEFEEPYTIASELLALRFIPFINYVLLQMQNLVVFLSLGFLLLLSALNSYVFRARTILDTLLTVLFLVLGSSVVTVFAQLDRDAVFSRITRTEQGRLDRNFFFHLIFYGGVPTVALLASHVPSVARFFFSWVKPAMDAIH
jgi:hypothetical protein